jgi:hypothetical protein
LTSHWCQPTQLAVASPQPTQRPWLQAASSGVVVLLRSFCCDHFAAVLLPSSNVQQTLGAGAAQTARCVLKECGFEHSSLILYGTIMNGSFPLLCCSLRSFFDISVC